MDDFYDLSEQEIAEYETWLDQVDGAMSAQDSEFVLPEDDDFEDDEDQFESYDENCSDEDEEVIGYDDLLNTEEDYRELNFND